MQGATLTTWLPLLILGVVFAFRLKRMQRARPFRSGRLWIQPTILVAVVTFMLFAAPPTGLAVAALFGGLAIGAPIGWRRAHMMHLEHDPAGSLMIRQTPAALILVLGLVLAKRLLLPHPAAGSAGHMTAQAMLVTDGLLGFALGMVIAANFTLWRRAQDLRATAPATAKGA